MSDAASILSEAISVLRFAGSKRLPMIFQTEAAECGLACLAMVASYFGSEIDLPGMRRRASLSIKGVSLKRIIEIAAQLKLDARPLQLEVEKLAALKTPSLLHWDLNHFVVLKKVNARSIVIHDPALGIRQISLTEASKHFKGVAIELLPSASFRRNKAREAISLHALAGNVHGFKRAMMQVLLLAIALEVVVLASPLYMQWVLDQVLPGADNQLLTALGTGFLLLTVFQISISAMRSWCITRISALVSIQWINNLFGHLLRLPLEFFEKRHIGDVVSRFGSVQTIQKTLTTQFVSTVLDGLMSILTLVLMTFYSVALTLLVVGAFVLYAALRFTIFRPLRRATEEHIIYAARQQSDLLESVRGIQALKLSNQHNYRRARYANFQVETINREVALQKLMIGFRAGNGVIFGLSRVILIWWAATLVLKGELSAGMMVAFIAYADQFSKRAATLIDRWNDFRMLRLHAERVADIALYPQEDLEGVHTGSISEARVEVKNLSFRYAEGELPVIQHFNLTIEPGESVAIAAPSGTGKTTLAKLILGLLQPTEGQISFGGIDIQKLGLTRYRDMVAAVMQDDQLFAGSIADNISLFDPDATLQKVEAAARLARIHDEIAANRSGYETLVGDMGSSLSGGQRQRILLARALYREPKLLVLDEATSYLDVIREREVNALIKHMKITRLVLAHRPETLASADRVIVLQKGYEDPVVFSSKSENI